MSKCKLVRTLAGVLMALSANNSLNAQTETSPRLMTSLGAKLGFEAGVSGGIIGVTAKVTGEISTQLSTTVSGTEETAVTANVPSFDKVSETTAIHIWQRSHRYVLEVRAKKKSNGPNDGWSEVSHGSIDLRENNFVAGIFPALK